MSYDPTIPTGSGKPSQQRANIQTNFSQVNEQYGVNGDHVQFNAGTNNGKHKKCTFVQRDAAQNTSANEMSVYIKSLTTTGVGMQPEIYTRQQSNGTEYLLTRGSPNSSAGEGFMYGGLQIRCGQCTTGTPVTFTTQFPTNFISIVLTPFANAAQVNVTNPTATGFTPATSSSTPVSAFYVAVGH